MHIASAIAGTESFVSLKLLIYINICRICALVNLSSSQMRKGCGQVRAKLTNVLVLPKYSECI